MLPSRLPVLLDLPVHEIHASFQLVHAVYAVLDADPAIEMDGFQCREDGIVIVKPSADFTMPQYGDRKSTRLNSSHSCAHRMTSSASNKHILLNKFSDVND